ncbi:hypothetical protein OIV83_003056 [Microbotryomycetes sp. JL201]|nr:hypothetical protein OIV83_003056 [Microbotryomycetes sp. JL201]
MATKASTAPNIPPRPQNQGSSSTHAVTAASDPFANDADPVPADPPPAYEAQPAAHHEQTLDAGPSRPFADDRPQPQSPSSLNAPQYPFWNGHNLTAQQTGFNPAASLWRPPEHAPPHAHPSPTHVTSSQPPRPNTQPGPTKYSPTTEPTDGQPLLNNGQLLVYPKDFVCHKCSNTGYKPFKNRAGDDPNHPCRKDWQKYGKPFQGALALSINEPAANYQRPIRLPPLPQPHPASFSPPPHGPAFASPPPQSPMMMSPYGIQQYHPPPPAMYGAPIRHGWGNAAPPGGAIVVRPGDPRIGELVQN